jgi:O-antigen ligase
MGVYLSYSRGAIAAALVGLIVLLAAAPTRPQLRATAVALMAALLAAIASASFSSVATRVGDLGRQETEGAVVLAILVAVAAAAGWVQLRACRAEDRQGVRAGQLAIARHLRVAAAVAVGLCLAGLLASGLVEDGAAGELSGKTGISRLASADSRRYDYWRVGLNAFADHPLRGVGSGGFRAEWVRERPVREAAREVHSLPLEMATELGLPGLLGLGLLVGGIAVAGSRALRRGVPLAPGAVAALAVWGLHAAIDWDWQVPAVTLPAIMLGAALISASESQEPVPYREPSGLRRRISAAA